MLETFQKYLKASFQIQTFPSAEQAIRNWHYKVLDLCLIEVPIFDFTTILHPISAGHYEMWIRNLKYQVSSDYFIKVFTIDLWIAVIISFCLIILLRHIVAKISIRHKDDVVKYSEEVKTKLIFSSVMKGIQFIVCYNIVTITFLLLSIIVNIAFETILTSCLAVKTLKLPFNDYEGLLKSDYSICVSNMTMPFLNLHRRYFGTPFFEKRLHVI